MTTDVSAAAEPLAPHGDGVTIGTFMMEFATTGIGALAAGAGAEFIFFDMQHTGWSVSEIGEYIAACRGLPIACGVRVPAAVPWLISAALDQGAEWIMVPAVDDAATAEAIVRAAQYPPAGERAITRRFSNDGYDPTGSARVWLDGRNARVRVFVQIETAAGLANVDEIAAVPGVDVLWVGDNDLSASIGVAGQFDSATFQDALDTVAAAARKAEKIAGFTTDDVAVAEDLVRRGYRCIALGNDIKLMWNALKSSNDLLRQAIARGRA